MDENRFFKWIWRMVAIGLLLLTIAGLYSFIETEIKRDNIYDMDEREPISTLAKDPQKVEKWVLRVAPYISDNSDYTVLALYSKYNKVKALNESYYEPKGYYQDMAKNILFVNTKDNSSHWLFLTNNQLILKYQSDIYLFLERNPYYINTNKRKEEKARFIYYTLINKDTNGDKIITKADHLNFAISDISGKNYKVVIENIETIINIKIVSKDTINIIYQKDGIAHSLKLNTNNFEIISDIELPKVGER